MKDNILEFGKYNSKKPYEKIIKTLASTIETRDSYTLKHQRKVIKLAGNIAKELNLSSEVVKGIKLGAAIHDIGKLNIPMEILSKPMKLNDHEFNLIKSHPKVGYEIIKNIGFPWPIEKMVLQHHERLDGSGYPEGLKEDEILMETKVIAVADVVEAMSSHRPYRPALGITKALDEISRNRGVLYDPDVVDACIKLFKEGFKFY